MLGRRGYQMLLANTDNVPDRELEYLDLFQNHPVDGIVLVATMITGEHRRAIESCRVPIVLIGQHVEGAACVYHDDYEAAFELGQALAKRAEGKIAYIGVTEEAPPVMTVVVVLRPACAPRAWHLIRARFARGPLRSTRAIALHANCSPSIPMFRLSRARPILWRPAPCALLTRFAAWARVCVA